MSLELNGGAQIGRICVQCSTNCSGPLEPYVERQFCRCTNNSNWRTFLMKTLPVNARRIRWSGLLLLVTAIIARPARGQNQELTFSLGGVPGQTRSFQGSAGAAQISADRSFGINYGHRLLGAKIAALYGEIEFVAIPNRALTPAIATRPPNHTALYLPPGRRLK